MFSPTYQAALDSAELAELEARWGALPCRRHHLQVDHPFLTGPDQMLVSNRRRAEVCYVMHRGDPAAGLLLQRKTFYPPGAYRLPTGGIHQGETVLDTLAREIYEETGLQVGTAPDQVQVQRCLGVIVYALEHITTANLFGFATYPFLVQMPEGASLAPTDPGEQIDGWQWRAAAALPKVAAQLTQVGHTHPAWGDWGRYRALGHSFVAERLASR